MRFYGTKFIGNRIRKEARITSETRNALVYDVSTSGRYARVKIQNSTSLVVAQYPNNWEAQPAYLKPGNAVTVQHTGGVRGRLYVVGHGATRPTLLAGDTTEPADPTNQDAVLTGCQVVQFPDNRQMGVAVLIGTYRIAGATYTTPYAPLDSSPLTLGIGGYLSSYAGVIPIDAAPAAGTYRYDILCIGTDGVIHVVKGSSTATPVMPSTTANHVLLGWVLLYAGMTEVTQADINKLYVAPKASSLTIAIDDDDLAFDQSTCAVELTVKDQYGNKITKAAPGWGLGLDITLGTGILTSGGVSSTESLYILTTAATHTFTYTRSGTAVDCSPIITGTCNYKLYATDNITLRDSSGAILYTAT